MPKNKASKATTLQEKLLKRFNENEKRYRRCLKKFTVDKDLNAKVTTTLNRLATTLAADEKLNDNDLQSMQGFLDAISILSLPFNFLNPDSTYQQLFKTAFITCLNKLTTDKSNPFTQEELALIKTTMILPIHLKAARKFLIENQMIKQKLTTEMRNKMFTLLDAIIPQEKKVSQFDFFGEGKKGQHLRQLLNEFKLSTPNQALPLFKEIVFEATRHRFQKQGGHSSTTGSASKILDALAEKTHTDLHAAFFGKNNLSRTELENIFDSIIKEKDPNYPSPYSGL